MNANLFFPLNLCGHVHRAWKTKEQKMQGYNAVSINVGVDVWNYYPVSLNEIIEVYNKVVSR